MMARGLFAILDLAMTVYILVVVAYVVSSWLNVASGNPLVRLLAQVTEPILTQLRRIVPLQFGGVDFSPAVLLVALSFLQRLIRGFLH